MSDEEATEAAEALPGLVGKGTRYSPDPVPSLSAGEGPSCFSGGSSDGPLNLNGHKFTVDFTNKRVVIPPDGFLDVVEIPAGWRIVADRGVS